jgi:phosphatidylglycerophosphatase A
MISSSRLRWLAHPVYCMAMGLGTGLAPRAPGTVGTLLGFPLYYLMTAPGLPGLVPWLLAAAFVLGIWLCDVTGRFLGEADHPAIVWDEVVAMAGVLALIPDGPGWQLAGFAVFRFFDIVKPWPIRYVDRSIKNGLGVMLDDAIAAAFTVAVIRLWIH